MDGEDHGDAIVQLGEDAAEVGVPGVEVDEVGVDGAGVEVEAALDGTEGGLKVFWGGPGGGVEGDAGGGEVRLMEVLVTEAADFDVDEFREFAGEVVDVDAGAAVDVGGEFVGEEESLHDVLL